MAEQSPIVLKYGTDSCVDTQGMRSDRLGCYAEQIATQQATGRRVVAVLSGAMAISRLTIDAASLEADQIPKALQVEQANRHMFGEWSDKLRQRGLDPSWMLVTPGLHFGGDRAELEEEITELTGEGKIVLVNEDDAQKHETSMDDNDRLAAQIAATIGAGELCLLSEQEGLLDRYGKLVKTISPLKRSNALELSLGKGPGGSGGMRSKVEAAIFATNNGVKTHIAHAQDPLQGVLARQRGTYFVPVLRAV